MSGGGSHSFKGGSHSFKGGSAHYKGGYKGGGKGYGHGGKGRYAHGGNWNGKYDSHHRGKYSRYRRYGYPWYGVYAYGGSGCGWLYSRALATGSEYWWSRYYQCIGYYVRIPSYPRDGIRLGCRRGGRRLSSPATSSARAQVPVTGHILR
jgi:hypothetical protein